MSRRIWSVPCLLCRDPVTTLIDDDVITSMSIACACAAVCTRSLNKVVKRLAAARSGTCCLFVVLCLAGSWCVFCCVCWGCFVFCWVCWFFFCCWWCFWFFFFCF